MSGVKYSAKTSSGDLGIGTVGPTEDVKGCIVGVTKLVDHTGGNVCVEETVDGAGGNVCVEEIVDGEAEVVAMGEWMQKFVDWICGRLTKYETWFSLGCVSVCDWWNCCVSWSHCRDGLGKSMV